MNSIGVMIIDDHPLMRVGIASIINSQPDMTVVAQAGTEDEAVELYSEKRPELTLMDLRLPMGSGLSAIRRIVKTNSEARIIVLTTYEGDEDIHQALTAGARAYLIKGMSPQALLEALRRVHAGRRFLPSAVSETLSSRATSTPLTEREQEVLQLVIGGRSNREIGDELQIRQTTVKTHVRVILAKLNVEDRTQAVVEALKRGLAHL